MIIAHLSVSALPADGTSVGRYVRRAVEVLRASGLRFEVHAMGTEIECGTYPELFRVIEAIDDALAEEGGTRVTLQLKIDHRLDKEARLEDKVRSATGPPEGAPHGRGVQRAGSRARRP